MTGPEIVKILSIVDESPTVKTFAVGKKLKARPGQFAMLWIPGVGEKPFSFSRAKGDAEFTVKKVGPFTDALFTLKEGDLIGFRGPYGNGFALAGKHVCVAAGGVGIAPMKPLIDELRAARKEVTVILGAGSASELLWTKSLRRKSKLLIATDDGTCGTRGSVCDVLHSSLEGIDQIYTCGPEKMMKIVADIAAENKIPCQVSLERYMKCGTGICGQCCFDPEGLRVCKDGPVFSAEQLAGPEFGKYRRDSSGSKQLI